MGDELREVFAQGGFAACEDDVRNACLPGFVHDDLPLFGGEFTVNSFDGGKICLRVERQAVGEGAIQPQCGICRMGSDPLKVEKRGGVQIGRGDQGVDLICEVGKICQRSFLIHSIAFGNLFRGFFGSCAFDEVIGVFGGGGIELQDSGCVEDEQARTIRAETKVQAIGLFIFCGLQMMCAFGQWRDF